MGILKKHILYVIAILIVIVFLAITNIGCPFLYLFGVPCPTCGMTRAFIALLRFDVKASISYNPMTIFMILAIFLGIHKKKIKYKKIVDITIIVIASLTFVFYVFKNFY